MNQNDRFCSQNGHEQQQANQVCTYRWCDMNRWCCQKCLNDNIHRHSMPNSNHIMNQAQLQIKVKQDIKNLKNEYLDSQQGTNIGNTRQQLVKELQELKKFIIDDWISDKDNFKLNQLIEKVEGENFKQLDDEDIDELVNIYQYQFNQNAQQQLENHINNVKQNLFIFKQNALLQQEEENDNKKIIDFQQRKYDLKIILEREKSYMIESSSISKNEQYLVYKVGEYIHIYLLKMTKNNKILKQKNQMYTFQFTNDSKILFAGDQSGFVYGYIVKNGFKTFYKQKIHQSIIIKIIIQQQYLITGSNDATIVKTNFIKKNQIFKLIGHSDYITGIDYDSLKDIMISTSIDKTIKIWDCLNQTILIDQKIHSLFLQLINNKQDILASYETGFQKFAIDYKNTKLVEICSYIFNNNDRVYYIQQINNDQHLLIIYRQYWIILNKEAEQIVKRTHNFNLIYVDFCAYPQQLDNLNYIILQDPYKLSILRLDKNRNIIDIYCYYLNPILSYINKKQSNIIYLNIKNYPRYIMNQINKQKSYNI